MRALDTREQQDGERCAPRRLHDVRQHISSGSPFEPTIGFSRAVRHENLVFVSATAAIWPDGHVDPDVGVQARRCESSSALMSDTWRCGVSSRMRSGGGRSRNRLLKQAASLVCVQGSAVGASGVLNALEWPASSKPRGHHHAELLI
jgi:hypothetical protein